MYRFLVLNSLCLLTLFSPLQAQQSPLPAGKKLHLWATYYHIPSFNHQPDGIDLLDKNNEPTGYKLQTADWCKAAIEGTVLVRKDEQTILFTYAGRSQKLQVDCRHCSGMEHYAHYEKTGRVLWEKGQGYGKGVQNYDLVPFRSIAVDPTYIPYGTVLYIPAAKGITYELAGKKQVHDGYFFACDTGAALRGNHIDIFLGTSKVNPFPFLKSSKDATFQAVVAKKQ